MNQKITIQELADSIAKKHDMSRKEAELFVRGIFELIEEALATEKYVKVKGLGTFKLIDVDSRESIDVNTGVRIEIQGHRKVSFLPEAALKELINKPFSHFETVLLSDGALVEDGKEHHIQKPWEVTEPAAAEPAAEPAVESLPVEVAATEPIATESIPVEPAATEPVSIEPVSIEPVSIEPASVEATATESTPAEPAVTESLNAEPVSIEPTPAEVDDSSSDILPAENQVEADSEQPTPIETESSSAPIIEEVPPVVAKRRNWLPILLVLVVLVIALSIYFVTTLKAETTPEVLPVVQSELVDSDVVQDSLVMEGVIETRIEEPTERIAEERAEKPVEESVATVDSVTKYEIVGTKAEYVIQRGETLIMVSVKFYGERELWSYLVEHNKATIKNPDNVAFGTKIRIPELRALVQ